jgi:glucan phosphoethanolaminetransferase (alkaline phosphatase superfamily)
MLDSQTLSAQRSTSTAISSEVSLLANNMFTIITDSRTQQGLSIVCVVLTVFIIYIWCMEAHRNFKKKGLRPKAKEIILPLILIALTFNNVRDMKDSMFNSKNTVNIVEAPSNKVMNKNNSQSKAEVQMSPSLKSLLNGYLLDI